MVDFHSHFPSENAFLCSADGNIPSGDAFFRSAGLLPRYWEKESEQPFFELFSSKEIGMGEIGLDKRFVSVCPMDVQVGFLEKCLRLADDENLTITLHCVHATGEMIRILKNCISGKNRVIWHGFNGSPETASELYRMGIITSIGPFFKGDVRRLFKADPLTVLETDYEGNDEKEYYRILSDHYRHIASELNITEAQLEEHCNGLA